jgi:hypothetical protein
LTRKENKFKDSVKSGEYEERNGTEKVQASATPATIFSLFYKGKFVTTDLISCMDGRFDKVIENRQPGNAGSCRKVSAKMAVPLG